MHDKKKRVKSTDETKHLTTWIAVLTGCVFKSMEKLE